MAIQQITVSAATKDSKFFDNEVIWGVKVGNSWMDLHTPNKPAKGAVLTVETWTVENKGRTYVHARPVAGQQPTQPTEQQRVDDYLDKTAKTIAAPVQSGNSNRATPYTHSFDEYATVARKAKPLAVELFADVPGDVVGAQERFTVAFMIAFGDGKLALPLEDEWGDVPSTSSAPIKYEKAQGHVHLEKTIWAYFERIDGSAEDAVQFLFNVSGKHDVLELSEKEAIQARLKAEKFIDEHTDYLALFTAEAKKIAAKEKWDFSGTDEGTKQKKKALLIMAGINKPFKELTQADLKAAVEKLTNNIPY